MKTDMDQETKVALAEFRKDIRYIGDNFSDFKSEIKEWRKEIKELVSRQEESLDDLDRSVVTLQERQSNWNYGLAIFSVIVGGIASFFNKRI